MYITRSYCSDTTSPSSAHAFKGVVRKYACTSTSDSRKQFRRKHASYLLARELVRDKVGEERLSLVVAHARVDDYVVADLPVDRGRDAVLVAELER
jgi:hypothetical protein